jgi:hypothetical protein
MQCSTYALQCSALLLDLQCSNVVEGCMVLTTFPYEEGSDSLPPLPPSAPSAPHLAAMAKSKNHTPSNQVSKNHQNCLSISGTRKHQGTHQENHIKQFQMNHRVRKAFAKRCRKCTEEEKEPGLVAQMVEIPFIRDRNGDIIAWEILETTEATETP